MKRKVRSLAALCGILLLVLVIGGIFLWKDVVNPPGNGGANVAGLGGSDSAGNTGSEGSGGAGNTGTEDSEGAGGAGPGDLANGNGTKPAVVEPVSLILPEGQTLSTRIDTPEGYKRVSVESGSLGQFLRDYPMKPDKSPILLYDGTPKADMSGHAAVFALPIANEDLQQCADSVMRVYAEYYWAAGEYDKIGFHFTDGFYANYSKWRDGYRIKVDGDSSRWVESKSYDDSYETFCKYLRIVFAYAGTLSMDREATPISMDEIRIGDVFLKSGSPGHVILVVDMCEDENGRKAVLLGQSHMPAQEFHVLKNYKHEDDPWYYLDEISFPLEVPGYVFPDECLKRLNY